MTWHPSIDISSADDPDLAELRVGGIVNIRGRLSAVRYGDRHGSSLGRRLLQGGIEAETCIAPTHADPSLVVTCADWSDIAVTLRDYATAKSIRIPLSTYVCVKAQKIHEDGDLLALAIWELGGGAVLPLGEPMRDPVNPQRTTVS